MTMAKTPFSSALAPFALPNKQLLSLYKRCFSSRSLHRQSFGSSNLLLCRSCKRSLSTGITNSWTSKFDKANGESSKNTSFQVVLCSPQIPGNTGSIARTCAATAIGLHLVEPLGFEIDDTKLKRAGLDYWPYVVVKVHQSWGEFLQYFLQQEGEKRLLAFTKKGKTLYTNVSYKAGDWLLFGSETSGLSDEILNYCNNDLHGGGTVRIPIRETYVRSLNLAVSVGVAIYEALRQTSYRHLDYISNETTNSDPIQASGET